MAHIITVSNRKIIIGFEGKCKQNYVQILDSKGNNLVKTSYPQYQITNIRQALAHLIDKVNKYEDYLRMREMSVRDKIASSSFGYARFTPSREYGNSYNIYWISADSPTGVELVGCCTELEWETLSKELNKSNQYLSPSEKW